MHERIQKNILKKIKETNGLEKVEADEVINLMKGEAETFSDADVYTDNNDNDDFSDKVVGFR